MTTAEVEKPLLLDLSNNDDAHIFEELNSSGVARYVIDEYASQLREWYAVENPQLYFSPAFVEKFEEYLSTISDLKKDGIWTFFPWSSTLIHILPDEKFQKVRTARNRELMTSDEQAKYYDACVGIAGLSVGNSIALALVLSGGARRIKLADHDILELSNLNRIRAGIEYLGLSKVHMTARQIYALNPYTEIELFHEGLTESNIDSFFDGVNIVIDEIDNLPLKFRIREKAKERKLPVLMAADNDRMGVLDIERYDLDPTLEFFHGKLSGTTLEDLKNLDKKGVGRTIATLVGLENHTERMLLSLREMGNSVVSWPQLGPTALLNGALVAHAAFRIANAQPLIENRATVGVDALLNADYMDEKVVSNRESAIESFRKLLS